MEDICLENLWRKNLKSYSYSDHAVERFLFHWAKSTKYQYNQTIVKYVRFCECKNVSFPYNTESVVADFLCDICDKSDRPKASLNNTIASLTCMFDAIECENSARSNSISKLVDGLIKSGTSRAMSKTRVMPIEPFIDLFEKWPENKQLCKKDLRMKTICLFALAFMTRPSDIAPKAQSFDPDTFTSYDYVFKEKQIKFENDGVTVVFSGIKNDRDRDGFTVHLPGNSNPKIDIVQTLKDYMQVTRHDRRLSLNNPVFVTLRQPFRAMSASAVSDVLLGAISAAGLGGQGFSAKNFRPTAASKAINMGVNPDIARHVGRWKCQEVFEKHYVHSKVPQSYVENLFSSI